MLKESLKQIPGRSTIDSTKLRVANLTLESTFMPSIRYIHLTIKRWKRIYKSNLRFKSLVVIKKLKTRSH